DEDREPRGVLDRIPPHQPVLEPEGPAGDGRDEDGQETKDQGMHPKALATVAGAPPAIPAAQARRLHHTGQSDSCLPPWGPSDPSTFDGRVGVPPSGGKGRLKPVLQPVDFRWTRR